MGLSKQYLDTYPHRLDFDPRTLGRELQKQFPEIVFAYLLGSAADGTVYPHSDLDLAIYTSKKADLDFYGRLQELCEEVVGPVRCDIGILNNAEPVFRFEALKGRLLFVRDKERWLTFYSRTCREYEHQLFHYEKQRRYRIEAAQAAGAGEGKRA
jgi:uncharacterized protein